MALTSLSPAPARGFLRRHARSLALSLLLAASLIWVLRAGGLPLLPPPGLSSRVAWLEVAAFALALLLSNVLRLGRASLLLSPIARVSPSRVLMISFIAAGLITFLPFRLGEVARPAMLREKGKLSGWAVAGAMAAERILDGLVFTSILVFGLAVATPQHPLPESIGNLPISAALVPRAALLASIAFGASFVVMVIFARYRATARALTLWLVGWVSKRMAERVSEAVEQVSDGLRFLPSLRHTGAFLLVTLVSLSAHVWGLQTLARAVDLPPLSFAQASVLLGVLGLGFAMPNAPGFFGTVQLALYAGLAVYVAPQHVVSEGADFVFIFYLVSMALVVLLTALGLWAEYRHAAHAPAEGSPLA